MATAINIRVDDAKLAAVDAELEGVKNGLNRAIAAAVNKTLTTVRSRTATRLSKVLNLKKGNAGNPEDGTIARFIGLRKARDGGAGGSAVLEGAVTIRSQNLSLMLFGPSPSSPGPTTVQGVTVKTRKNKARELLRSTFVQRMKSGHVGVFERRRGVAGRFDQSSYPFRFAPSGTPNAKPGGHLLIELPKGSRTRRFARAGPSGRAARLPLQERFGPTPYGVFENAPGVAAEVIADAGDVLYRNIDSQVDRLLGRRKADRTEPAE